SGSPGWTFRRNTYSGTRVRRGGGRRAVCGYSRLHERGRRARPRRPHGPGSVPYGSDVDRPRDGAQKTALARPVDLSSLPPPPPGLGRGGVPPEPRSGDGGLHASCCRRRNAGTSSGDTGSNSAPRLRVSRPRSFAAAGAGGGAGGISSTGRRETDRRAPPPPPPPPDAAIFSVAWKAV